MDGKRRVALWAGLLGLAVLSLSAGLGRAPLMDVDEAAYARIARTMVETGDWLVPRFRGDPAFFKPPLYCWLVASSFVLQGFTEWAVRSVSLLFALLTLALTGGIARRTGPARGALLAPLLLATSPGFVVSVRSSTTDMTLAAWIALAFYGFVRGYDRDDARPDVPSFLALWGGMALATLTKGPIGTGIPLGAIFLYLLATRRPLRFARLSWLPGLALWAVVVLPWYVTMTQLFGAAFLEGNLVFHNLAKFLVPGLYRVHPGKWFLAENFLWLFFPWVLPLAALAIARVVGLARRAPVPRGEALAWMWLLFPAVVFSFSQFKMPSYLLPCLPAAALLAARPIAGRLGWDRDAPTAHGATPALLAGAAGVTLLAFLGLAVWFPVASTALRVAPLAVGLAALLAIAILSRRAPAAGFALGIAAMAAGIAFATTYVEPRLEPYAPFREIGRELRVRCPERDPVTSFRCGLPASLDFYSGRSLIFRTHYKDLDNVRRLRGTLVLTDRMEFDALPADWRAGFRLLGEWKSYHIAQIKPDFLNPATRPATFRRMLLLETNPTKATGGADRPGRLINR